MTPRKYRGKRKDNGEWVYGSLILLGQRCLIVSIPPKEESPVDEITLYAQVSAYAEVIPKTVGQYTSLKNKDLWEGDILESEDGLRRFTIAWDDIFGSWYLKGIDKAWCVYHPNWRKFKKIGTIHDKETEND